MTVAWIITVCVHEYSHAYVAYKGGDMSVKEKGYLSFNPIKYMHPMFSIIMPLVFLFVGGIGLPGAAVYVNKAALRNKLWRSGVSIAGPLSTIFVAGIIVAVFHMFPDLPLWIRAALAFLFFLEITSVVICFLPIPPLDGYGTIEPFLGKWLAAKLAPMGQWGMWVVVIALIGIPQVRDVFWGAINSITDFCGVDPVLVHKGYMAFKFWVTAG